MTDAEWLILSPFPFFPSSCGYPIGTLRSIEKQAGARSR